MNQATIFYPMMALALWTFLVLILIPFTRFRAAFKNQVVADDFKYGESQNVPAEIRLPNQNYMNLLEIPVLFYVVSITLYVTHLVDGALVLLAWAYVVSRFIHSLVHLTYNNVMHRLSIFVISNIILAVIWIRLLMASLYQANV